MRVVAILLGLMVGLAVLCSPRALAQEKPPAIPLLVDGLPLKFDVLAVIQDGRALVPFRAIAEALNVQVSWDGSTRTVNATDGTTSVQFTIGSPVALWNDVPITLDVAPVIANGRTLIPLRFFSEVFGCSVKWLSHADGVRIMSRPVDMEVLGFYALGDSQTSSWTDLFGRPYPDVHTGNTDMVRTVSLGWYSVDGEGGLLTRSRTGWQRPSGWEDVLKAARGCSLKTEMVIHAVDEDRSVSSLLASDAAVARLAGEVMEEVKHYDGVNVDFEGLGLSGTDEELSVVRGRFTALVQALSERLRGAGKGLTVTLHAPNSAYRGYDYEALGRIADRVVVMAYDYGPRPEPTDLVMQAVEAARAIVPAERLLLGVSAPSETNDSMIAKIGIAKRYRLGGIALWRLGVIGEKWDALRASIKPREQPGP